MKFGAYMFPTDYSIGPIALGRELEQRGYESLFFPEHTHIPASRATPYPGGGDLPKEYANTLDPFVALATVAATTQRLRLGTGIALVVERDPIVLAKEVATLDLLSGGRVLLGVGGGWNREEMANHGTDPRTRWKLLRERIEAMKTIWSEDQPEYHGEFVDFDPLWQWPKPLQKPHPPILLGNNGPGGMRRAVAFADEWLPIPGRHADALADRIAELQRLAAEAGRDPLPVSVFGARPNEEAITELAEAGVHRALFPLPPAPESEVIPLLDRQTRVIEQFG